MSCTGSTRTGAPCRNRPEPGSDRCHVHRRAAVDEAAVAQLEQLLRAGNYLEVAARAAGIPLEELPPELLEAIDMARAEGEARAVAMIARAAGENWQAAAWLLERSSPERWARPMARAAEEPELPLAPAADGVDELAGKRDARRAARR